MTSILKKKLADTSLDNVIFSYMMTILVKQVVF